MPDYDPNAPERLQRLIMQDLASAQRNVKAAQAMMAQATDRARELGSAAAFDAVTTFASGEASLVRYLETLESTMAAVEAELI